MNQIKLPSPELVQNVLMASPNGVLVLQAIRSADGSLIDLYMTMVNAVAAQELGCPAVEALGQSFSQAFPHLAEKKLLEQYRKVLDTGQSAQFEVNYFRPGQLKISWLSVSVVRLKKNILITFTDSTDTKTDVGEESIPCNLPSMSRSMEYLFLRQSATNTARSVISD
jgi:PAS domain-containing protein